MPEWLHAEYRDFDGVPRAMLCTSARGCYYFLSRFDAAGGRYSGTYEAYRIRPPGEGEACQSWFGLESRAEERLPDIPVDGFPFDPVARRFLAYDAIASVLGERPAVGDAVADCLQRQFSTAWKLASYHLDGLTEAECLWRPADRGPHVIRSADGEWRGEWPEHEGYDLGPPSIAWLTWHIGLWWSMTLDHSFGSRTLERRDVTWPGSADGACRWIAELSDQWQRRVGELGADDLQSSERTRWPFAGRPFADVVAWVNIELTKNASEIGYARFLHARRNG
jgi:hypothetical protein